MRRLFLAAIAAGALSFLAFILKRLALTDVLRGEADLRLEWAVISGALPPIALFHVLGLVSVIIAARRADGAGRRPAQPPPAVLR